MRVQIIMLSVVITSSMGCSTAPNEETIDEVMQEANSAESVDAKIGRNFQLMGDIGTEGAWQASLGELRVTPGVVGKVVAIYDQYSQSESSSDPESRLNAASAPTAQSDVLLLDAAERSSSGELRWRAVHLLGYLGSDAIIPLDKIAMTPLPDQAADERVFAAEYRIRLRAIAGLGHLNARQELQRLYAAGGMLRRAAASALVELGQAPPGFRMVDAHSALANEHADFTDINPNRRRRSNFGKPVQPVSGSLATSPR